MKTLGRILIILLVFAAFSALMIVGVNASGVSSSSFPGEGREFRPGADGQGFPPSGFQPGADGAGFRPERGGDHDGERGGGGVIGLLFGAIKNTLVIALLVVAVVLPKSITRKKRRNDALTSTTAE